MTARKVKSKRAVKRKRAPTNRELLQGLIKALGRIERRLSRDLHDIQTRQNTAYRHRR